jgi:membrane-associated protein
LIVLLAGIVESLIHLIAPAYSTWGYLIITVGVLAERSILIGLFVPGDVILALGGIFAARSRLDLHWVILIGTFAAIIGESIGYWLGRKYGMGLIRHIPIVRLLENRLEGAEEYFKKHGGKTVALGRYATAAGAFIPFVAGMARMRYARFLLFDIPAIVIWAAGITLFGYFFNEQLDFVDRMLSRFGLAALGLLLASLAVYLLLKRRRDRAESKAGAKQDS